MLNSLHHRGPDQSGYKFYTNLTFGHKRLSIQDLSECGKQPMELDDYSIVFNGEIFNFIELKHELNKRNIKFKSNTDTEVILYYYKYYGEKCLDYFNGQFSFAIYDKKKQTIFIARDRMGIKPLYYYLDGETFIFASELKAILEFKNINKKINNYSLKHYLLFGYCPLEFSIFENIRKLMPSHYLIYNLKSKEVMEYKKYWDNIINRDNKVNLKNNIHSHLEKSIAYRTISDRPVGVLLSGGIDSSLLVCLLKNKIKNLKTFTISFDNSNYDESQYAKLVSKKFNTMHYEKKFTSKDIIKLLPEIINQFDEPLGDNSIIPNYLVSKLASEHVTVVLSGAGGDELFCGYKRYFHFNILKYLVKLPSFFKNLIKIIIRPFNSFKYFSKLNYLLYDSDSYFKIYSKLFNLYDKRVICNSKDFKNNLNKYFKSGSVDDAILFDQSEYLPNDLLYKEDMCCMAHSIEGRFPFLDHNFVKYINSTSLSNFSNFNKGKIILKSILSRFMGSKFVNRKKQGFVFPLSEYIKNDLKDIFYNEIFNFNGYNYYDKKIIKTCWDEHQLNKKDYSDLFFKIFMFNNWYKNWA